MACTRRTSKRGRDDRIQTCQSVGVKLTAPLGAIRLDKTLRREVRIRNRAYIVAISPLTLKLTAKGKRMGLELNWEALVNGDAALAAALNASVGKLSAEPVRLGKTRNRGVSPKNDSPEEASTRHAELPRHAKREPR
jgi:hypothetical protein